MRFLKVAARWLHYAWTLVLEGDGNSSLARLILIGAVPLGLAVLGRALEPFHSGEALMAYFPQKEMADLAELCLSFLRPNALRYWVAPLAALAWAVALGALYLQDAYKFERFAQALSYLMASLFGFSYPTVTVMDGQMVVPGDEPNTLQSIGGPGYLEVRPGNVVLLERGAGPTNVYGAGRYFVRRFEAVREILDLREIYRNREAVEATTKDGIAITVRNVEATFRVDTGRQPQRTEIEPYPFAIKAVRAVTYRRAVDEDGHRVNWGDLIMSLISGRIAAWVSRQRLDHLTAPTVDDPRAALHSEFEGADFRRLLSRFGAELVRVNIGHLDTPSPVDSQRIESWQSIWQLQDKITLAQGEAVQLAYEELGRAEGQAEMLKAIARALEDILPNPPAGDMEISRLVILRISQLLDTMSPREKLGEPKAPPTASSGPKQ